MRVSDLLRLAVTFASLGILLFLLLLVCYFLLYRKVLNGRKRLSPAHILWWGVFFCYCFIVAGVTILFRSKSLYPDPIHGLFYSYRDAWAHWSIVSWRNIILNFCMFIPLGILLPLRFSIFQNGLSIALTGFCSSLLIELIQLFSHRGMFEPDDLLGNTIGTLIGYGLYLMGCHLFRKPRGNKPVQRRRVLLGQLPLLLTLLTFSVIFLTYACRKLGINPDSYVTPYDTSLLQISSQVTFSEEKHAQMIYRVKPFSASEEKLLAERILQGFGESLEEKRTDSYENTTLFRAQSGRYSLWIRHKGGAYQLTDFQTLFPEEGTRPQPSLGASREEILRALSDKGILLPEGTDAAPILFEERQGGWYVFTLDGIPTADGILKGKLSCLYYGEGKIAEINNEILSCTKVKEYPLLSEQEAYERLQKGKFFYPGNDPLEIQVTGCTLVYVTDSKGFLQPSYEFEGMINGGPGYIRIPALRK